MGIKASGTHTWDFSSHCSKGNLSDLHMTRRVFCKNLLTWSFLFRYLSNYALYHLSLIPIFLLFHSYNQIKAIRIKMIITCKRLIKTSYFSTKRATFATFNYRWNFQTLQLYIVLLDDVWGSTPFGLNNLVRATQLSEPVAFYRLFIIWCHLYLFHNQSYLHANQDYARLCR